MGPRFTVPFSHGKDSHTLQAQKISSAADGKQMSLAHSQCTLMPLHENVDASSEKQLHICFTPLGYLLLIHSDES